jgi:hypothetical protein
MTITIPVIPEGFNIAIPGNRSPNDIATRIPNINQFFFSHYSDSFLSSMADNECQLFKIVPLC